MRVGLAFPPSKRAKLEPLVAHLVATGRLEPVDIDLARDVAAQGPFDVVLHKLTDYMVTPADDPRRELLARLLAFLRAHPEVPAPDPPAAIERVLERTCLADCAEAVAAATDGRVRVAPFVRVDDAGAVAGQVAAAGLAYPLLCKPNLACGTVQSHQMSIVGRASEFDAGRVFGGGAESVALPAVVQPFINHCEVLFKVYVLGRHVDVVSRRSLPDFVPGRSADLVAFNSQRMPNREPGSKKKTLTDLGPVAAPAQAVVESAARAIGESLGLTAFGFDMILDMEAAGKQQAYYVVDINYFPGYDGVPEFGANAVEWIDQAVSKKA